MTTGDPSGAAASPEHLREVEDRIAYLKRWLRVWIALLVVATLVIVVYLIIIASSLHTVNGNIAAADKAVRAVRANVSILPGQINTVNSHLGDIDRNLDQVPDRVGQVNDSLRSVDDSLGVTSGSLADTADTLPATRDSLAATDGALATINASLQDTNGSLKDTSSLLVSVEELAGKVEATLEDAESPPNTLDQLQQCPPQSVTGSVCVGQVSGGAEGIYERVAVANSVLVAVRRDTGNILGSLVDVNGHLESICEAPALQAAGVFPPC